MTNNQLTDAQISNATLIRLILWADEHKSHYVAAALRELQERRKAEVDNEPVAEVVSIYGDPEAFGEREIRPLVGIQQMPYGTKLYRHAQQPVVPEEMTIMDACKFVQDMRLFDDVSVIVMRTWNACRATMLQAGNSPAQAECTTGFESYLERAGRSDATSVIAISLVSIARRTAGLLRQLDFKPNEESENPIEVLLFDAEKVESEIKEMKKSRAAMLSGGKS